MASSNSGRIVPIYCNLLERGRTAAASKRLPAGCAYFTKTRTISPRAAEATSSVETIRPGGALCYAFTQGTEWNRWLRVCRGRGTPGVEAMNVEVPGISRHAPEDDPKIAVVVIHGMGEQKPMQTLRGFVETAWQRNRSLFDGIEPRAGFMPWDVWSKPDQVSGSAELRRITTARARHPTNPKAKGQRADFFELHWADLTADSTWGDFVDWFRLLLLRNPLNGGVPPRVLVVWVLLWAFTIVLGLSVLAAAWPALAKAFPLSGMADTWIGRVLGWGGWAGLAAALAIGGVGAKKWMTRYFGDVARYVSAAPRNIKVRHEARQRGLKLLNELAACGEYDRIIVVGHSLGSVLAHDLVLLAWSEASRAIHAAEGSALHAALRQCETASVALLDAAGCLDEKLPFLRNDRGSQCRYERSPGARQDASALAAFRESQRRLFRELAATPVTVDGLTRSSAWLISDLVTLGSPLGHAEFLITDSLCELRTAVMMRELLRCPPVLESTGSGPTAFSFESPRGSGNWRLHHAAAMAPVRWTNIHDASSPLRFWLGDLISGPVARDFGPGVVDVQARIVRPSGVLKRLLLARLFTHTLYWTDFVRGFDSPMKPLDHVRALHEALNFLDDPQLEQALLRRCES